MVIDIQYSSFVLYYIYGCMTPYIYARQRQSSQWLHLYRDTSFGKTFAISGHVSWQDSCVLWPIT